ncbi:MAG TPA: cache domain-containing protein [Pyrinomonadaceae bacterium]|nr:cache domain-containing protein [Pyrinomonadaceae bacterium]
MGFVENISRTLPTAAKLRIALITVLILLVPFFVYYLFYIKSQTDYFTNRNFRALARVGNQVTTKVESLSSVLRRVGQNFVDPDDSIAPADGFADGQGAAPRFTPGASNSEKNYEGLKQVLKNLKDYGTEIEAVEATGTSGAEIARGQRFESKVSVAVKAEDGVMRLYFDLQYTPADKTNVVTIRARTDFNKLIEPILGEHGAEGLKGAGGDEGFADILITEPGGDGRVLFQQSASELRLVSLDKLTAAGEDGKTIELATLGRSSSVADVRLAGSEYKLFIHPLSLSVQQTAAEDGRSLHWMVCGLVPASRFRREVWAISYSVLIVFAFLTALAILSWPFFKLLLIGSKDRLRTADIYFLFFSSMIGLALLTSFGLYGYSYHRLERQMDDQLAGLARQVKENFGNELSDSLAQLKALNSRSGLRADIPKLTGQPGDAQAGATASRKRLYRLDVLKNLSRPPYPYFDTAVVIDRDGEQRLKWTVRDYPPQFINVSARPYFTNLKEGRYRRLDGHEFWLEPIVSKTTGRNEVEISEWMPEEGDATGEARPGRRWVSAFDTRLLSLVQPVLPAGFGFCVLDDDGRVLFHSDETRHLGENFFQESDDNRALRSAVIDRREGALDVGYLGRGHRVYTTPVEGFPNWTVVAFRDKQVLRTAFLELLTLSSMLFLVYCMVVLAVLSIFYVVNLNANERRAWLWPSSQRTFSYYISVALLFALFAFSTFAYSRSGIWSMAAVSLLSFLGTCLFFVNMRFGKYGRPWKGIAEEGLWGRAAVVRRSLNRYDFAYGLNIVFLFLLVAIIPSAAFFKYAYESEITLFVRHGQITIARGLAEREERIRGQYADTFGEHGGEAREAITTRRLAERWDVYEGFFFDTTRGVKEGGAVATAQPARTGFATAVEDFFVSRLSELTPRYNHTSIERLGLNNGAFADCSYVWIDDGNASKELLHINRSGACEPQAKQQAEPQAGQQAGQQAKQPYLETKVPPLGWPGTFWWLLFCLLCVPLFCFWVHYIVKRIFLLNLYAPSSCSLSDLLSPEFVGNRFVVLEPPYTQRDSLSNERFHRIDLKKLACAPDWAVTFDYDLLAAHEKVIALDNFEHRASDPAANCQKSLFLQELLARRRKLLIVSTIEPSLYNFGVAPDDSNNSKPSEELDRWSMIVSNFYTAYMEDNGESDWATGEFEQSAEEAHAKGEQLGRSREEVEELVRTLKAECAPKAPLQHVAREIIRQRDFAELSPDHLVSRIRVQAGTYYQNIWESCSNYEKLTLYHLAQDRLLSPNDPEIAQLLRKRLIVRDPDIHLFNESFRRFVKSQKAMQAVAQFEKEMKKDSLWHVIKAPLLIVLVSVVLFLFITQRDLYTSSLAIMTAITTAIPAFFKVLSLFQKDPMNAPAQQ